MRTVDDKVYAVSHSVGDKVYSYGPGTYLGAKVVGADPSIPLPAGFMGEALAEIEGENPLIRLDTGEYIWGCECWWGGDLASIQKRVSALAEFVMISIDDKRKEYASKS